MSLLLTRRRESALRTILGLLMFVVIACGIAPSTGLAQSDKSPAHLRNSPPTLDLAALVLTTDVVADLGFEEYGSDHGAYLTAKGEAQVVEYNQGLPAVEALEMLEATGFKRSYVVRLALPEEPGTSGTLATEGLFCYIYEFTDEAGAAEAFPLLAGQEGHDDGDEVDGAHTVGDESLLTGWDTPDIETGDPMATLDLSFRAGRFYAGVTLWDVARSGEGDEAVEPSAEDAEDLAFRLLERIENGLDGEVTPDLSNQVLRLDIVDPPYNVTADRYVMADGVTYRYFLDSDERFAERTETFGSAGMIDIYSYETAVSAGPVPDASTPYYIVRVIRFEDDDAAEFWLVDGAAESISSNSMVSEFETVDDIPELGDGSFAAAYAIETGGDLITGHIAFVRVGDVVTWISFDAAAGIELDVVLDLMEAQVECIDGGNCVELTPVPEEVFA